FAKRVPDCCPPCRQAGSVGLEGAGSVRQETNSPIEKLCPHIGPPALLYRSCDNTPQQSCPQAFHEQRSKRPQHGRRLSESTLPANDVRFCEELFEIAAPFSFHSLCPPSRL